MSFLDDDVKVDANRLSAVTAVFKEYPAPAVGGKSCLIYAYGRPSWLPKHYESRSSWLDYGDRAIVKSIHVQIAAGGYDNAHWLVLNPVVSREMGDF